MNPEDVRAIIDITRRPRVEYNFPAMLRELRVTKHLSRNRIADLAQIPRTSIFNYERGATPLHPAGERMLDLWCEITGNHRAKAPMRPTYAVGTASQTRILSKV